MIQPEPSVSPAAIVAPAPAAPALTLDALASRIAGKPVRVLCPTLAQFRADPTTKSIAAQYGGADPGGYAEPWAGSFTLPRFECLGVRRELLANPSGAGMPSRLGYVKDTRAVFAFFHESEHLAAYPDGTWSDEHATDCRAIVAEREILPALGLPSERVGWMVDAALAIHSLNPAPYAGPCP